MPNFWPSSGFTPLQRNERGWLLPTDDYLRLFLARPELALVAESCQAELVLHDALLKSPSMTVTPAGLQAVQDADARDSYQLFLRFREIDVEATALLNDLYEGRDVAAARLQRLVSLFRLVFADSQEMRADVAGKPVFLGLMMNAEGVLKLKPQNLLVNLPLRMSM